MSESPKPEDGRKCTSCKKPVRGHKGPVGRLCENKDTEHISVTDENSESQIPDEDPPGAAAMVQECTGMENSKILMVLSQLTQHMCALNTNIEGLRSEQARLFERLGTGEKIGPAFTNSDSNVSVSGSKDPGQRSSSSETRQLNPTTVPESLESGQTTNLWEKVRSAAIRGEFVNLADFIGNNDSPSLDVILEHSDKPVKNKRAVDNFDTWLSAWSKYEALLVQHHPSLYPNVAAYRRLIQKCNHKYVWQAVYCYDVSFRAGLGANRSFEFHSVDTDLFVTILDSTAVKPNATRCYGCRSFDHIIQNCPFPTDNQVEKNSQKNQNFKAKSNQKYDRWFHNGVEGCNNWQYDRCTFPNCKRANVCKGCRGHEPFSKCQSCNKS